MKLKHYTQEEFDALRYDDPRGEGYTLKTDVLYAVEDVVTHTAMYGVTPDGIGVYWYDTEAEARYEHE